MKEISPHYFRRTSVSDLLDILGDRPTAYKLAGHTDPVIARYDSRGERTVRQAPSHLHVPT